MKKRTLVLLVVLLAVLAAAVPSFAAKDPDVQTSGQRFHNNVYIVQVLGDPVLTYSGGEQGFAATAPATGKKVDPRSSKVTKYADHLKRKHDQVLSQVGGAKLYSYTFSFNGFAAELSEGQVAALRSDPNVVLVSKDEFVVARWPGHCSSVRSPTRCCSGTGTWCSRDCRDVT